MTEAELKVRGENAARLLGDRLLNESLDAIERDILEEWENCPARDGEGREELWKYYKVAKKFRGILKGMLEDGKMALIREREKGPFEKMAAPFTRLRR